MKTMNASAYPLTPMGLALGAVCGSIGALMLTPLMGFALFVLCVTVGATWRADEPPILPFVLAFQWISVCIALFYERWIGPVPHAYQPADLDLTVRLSLFGLLLLAAGMRLGAGGKGRRQEEPFVATDRGVSTLFWIVIGLYAIDYVRLLNPREFLGLSSIVDKALQFRQVLVMTLWAVVLTGRRHRLHYLIASFVWMIVPTFGRYYSDFRIPVFLLLLTLIATWRPWDREWWRQHAGRTLALIPITALAFGLALLWQGAVKNEARRAQDQGDVSADPLDRVAFFVDSFQTNLPGIIDSTGTAVEDLVARLSYVTFFSRALDHTPAIEPHADGELLWMAAVNGTVPRFLFTDKPELPPDSEYTRRFAGVRVMTSMDSTVSVSMGYMAEFYADWGLQGMFLSVFAYGLWAGLLHRGVRRLVGMPLLAHGAVVVVLLPTLAFEHQFVRGFASLNIGFVVTVLLSIAAAPTVTRLLSTDARRSAITLWSDTGQAVDGHREA